MYSTPYYPGGIYASLLPWVVYTPPYHGGYVAPGTMVGRQHPVPWWVSFMHRWVSFMHRWVSDSGCPTVGPDKWVPNKSINSE